MPCNDASDQHTSCKPSRRAFLAASMLGTAGLLAHSGASQAQGAGGGEAAPIGSRRELFVDSALIENLTGGAQQQLHHPVPREVALEHFEPWEGTGCGYNSVFQDGDLYRMYYKAWHIEVSGGKVSTNRHPLFCCYAESDDGITWRKPELGLHEFQGSKKNNIVMASGDQGPLKVDAGHPAVFKDENPDAPADARYKALLRSSGPSGLLPFKSSDGIHWSPMADAPLFHGIGAFDSQNLAFWDPTIKKYRAYWRIFTEGVTTEKDWRPGGYRAIRTATSDDFLNWGPHQDLTYEDSPNEHLYTNQIKPYHRAPHLLLGFPARYVERGWSDSMRSLPGLPEREARAAGQLRYGTALTETLIMASRDGRHFTRWNEGFMRPGVERPGTWHYGQQYIAWHLVETKSALPGAPDELSLYSVEDYWHGPGSVLRRYTLRLDGFVSVSAPMSGGELVTKPVVFDGKSLHLNFATSAAGRIRVGLQTPDGKPIEGYALDDCNEVFGDTVDRVVTWKGGADVGKLAGQPVRVRFELHDADLYAYCFE
jgi:hypothetical protein